MIKVMWSKRRHNKTPKLGLFSVSGIWKMRNLISWNAGISSILDVLRDMCRAKQWKLQKKSLNLSDGRKCAIFITKNARNKRLVVYIGSVFGICAVRSPVNWKKHTTKFLYDRRKCAIFISKNALNEPVGYIGRV